MVEPSNAERAESVVRLVNGFAASGGYSVAGALTSEIAADIVVNLCHLIRRSGEIENFDAGQWLALRAAAHDEEFSEGPEEHSMTHHYTCPACGHHWQDAWPSGCDDTCPACGTADVSPDASEDGAD